MKTAVEFLIERVKLFTDSFPDDWEAFEEALKMEKEQIIDANIEGQRVFDKHPHTQWTNDQAEHYYNKTFKTKSE